MKIETKYNIGDTVWIPRKFWLYKNVRGIYKPEKGIVVGISETSYAVNVGNFGHLEFEKQILYPTQDECRDECNRLNGEAK